MTDHMRPPSSVGVSDGGRAAAEPADPPPGHNIDGFMPELEPYVSEYTHRRRFGFDDIEVGYDGFEPDGELFAKTATVHIERMDDNAWWMSISTDAGHEFHINFWSKKPITVRWSDESE